MLDDIINTSHFLGYAFGLIVEACTRFQSETVHKEPVHVTAHFLRATNVGPAEVHVRVQKIGKNFTNLSADLTQGVSNRLSHHDRPMTF